MKNASFTVNLNDFAIKTSIYRDHIPLPVLPEGTTIIIKMEDPRDREDIDHPIFRVYNDIHCRWST
jgi:hypothetical protein